MTSAAKGGLWLGATRLATQAVSWAVTVVVARILVPEDYGLVELAAVITGFVEVFSEFGLGSAVVQRPNVTREELSSTFWLSCLIGAGLGLLCTFAATPAALALGEPRVEAIVQVSSAGFLIGSSSAVPINVLSKGYRFQALGAIQFAAVVISSGSMLAMAASGFGVWTLVLGTLVLRTATAVLALYVSGLRPALRLRPSEVRPYVRFGANIVASRVLYFVVQRIDRLIVGSMLGVEALGLYGFARHLAGLPNDKVVAVVGQVSFPVLSRHQDDADTVRSIYLGVVRYVSLALAPLFLLGVLFGDSLVTVLLGDRWLPLAALFRWFCIGQFVVAVTSINSIVHNAQGRPHWVLYASLASTFGMPLAVYAAASRAAPGDLAVLALPWVLMHPLICLVFAFVTLRRLAIPVKEWLAQLRPTAGASALGALGALWVEAVLTANAAEMSEPARLLLKCLTVTAAYVAYLVVADRPTLRGFRKAFQ